METSINSRKVPIHQTFEIVTQQTDHEYKTLMNCSLPLPSKSSPDSALRFSVLPQPHNVLTLFSNVNQFYQSVHPHFLSFLCYSSLPQISPSADTSILSSAPTNSSFFSFFVSSQEYSRPQQQFTALPTLYILSPFLFNPSAHLSYLHFSYILS